MLTKKEVKSLQEHLKKAKNPIFFFDNDPDGLCSFVILKRYLGRGMGIVLRKTKSSPAELNKDYFKKVEENNADYIFVLDKPVIEQEFIDLAEEKNIPLVHLDHHNVPHPKYKNYYNPFHSAGTIEPTCYLCYKLAENKEYQGITAVGCLTEVYLPDFMQEYGKANKDLVDFDYKSALDILYNTQLGKITMMVSFAMRDDTEHLDDMIKFLLSASKIEDLIIETPQTKEFLERFEKLYAQYKKLIKEAEAVAKGDIIYLEYHGKSSMIRFTAHELFYRHPQSAVIVVHVNKDFVEVSLRWNKDIVTAIKNTLNIIRDARGGGRGQLAAAYFSADQLPKFKKKILNEITRLR
jgi:single-stranded DNA-specific DHH superfamily exonuclease